MKPNDVNYLNVKFLLDTSIITNGFSAEFYQIFIYICEFIVLIGILVLKIIYFILDFIEIGALI